MAFGIGALASFALVGTAGAQPRAPSPDVPLAASPAAVVVTVEGGGLDPASVRAAIAKELGVPAVDAGDPRAASARGQVSVAWDEVKGELAVAYAESGRAPLVRVLPVKTREDALPSAALLVGNLARREADDLLAAQPARPAAPVPPPSPSRPAPYRFANLALAYPLATNGGAPDLGTSLELEAAYGQIGHLQGLSVGGGASYAARADGVQIAGGAALVGGAPMRGAQIAGGLTLAGGDAAGVQIGGGGSYAGGVFAGLQIAGGASVARGHLTGLQISGGASLAPEGFAGVQIGGGLAYGGGDARGVQIGSVNVAGTVRGAQIGAINYADHVEGVQLGLVNVDRSGSIRPIFWSGNTTHVNAGAKFVAEEKPRRLRQYSITSVSVRVVGDHAIVGPALALGMGSSLGPVHLDFDVQVAQLYGRTWTEEQTQVKERVMVGLALARRFEVFAGFATAFTVYHRNGNENPLEFEPEGFGGVAF